MLRNAAGRRMAAYNVQYLLAAIARDAGIVKHLTPHGLRQTQSPSGWMQVRPCATGRTSLATPDPDTTRGYDRSRHALNRHATYAIAHHHARGT